jgi:acyl-coenzyme A synthetase/AMP-(fatty) acid ligase
MKNPQLLQVPDVLAGGRWSSADEIAQTASGWAARIRDAQTDDGRPIAAAVPTTPEGVALFIAVTSLPAPVILLEPDPRGWQSDPPVPPGTLVVLPPSLAPLARTVSDRGYVPCMLGADPHGRPAPPLALLKASSVILFTSGSTGSPKPVVRGLDAVCANVAIRLSVLGLERGEGIIAGASLVHGNGFTRLVSAMVLNGPLALLNPFDHRAALATLARPEFQLWTASAHFVDVLGRCALTGPAVAPRICLLTGPLPQAAFERFVNRFGVPLRQNYSSTETGSLSVDAAPAAAVERETVGHPFPGIDLRVGDRPDAPASRGTVGRIWVRTPWLMDGYGFPPHLERPGMVDGWWPMRDLGSIQPDGRLKLAGRMDDCIRTREGRLVNLFAVANNLRDLGGVRAAEVVPIVGTAGMSFGAVLECDPSADVTTLRRRLSNALPSWSWPRRIVIVPSLPRLPNGKTDRSACRNALATIESV